MKQRKKVKLVAPSHHITNKHIENAQQNVKLFEKDLIFDSSIKNKYLYYAGTPQRRAKEINDAYSNNEVDFLFSARGGNSTIEVLPLLDFDLIKANPKPILGFSDVTILLNAISQKTNQVMIHGPTQNKPFVDLPGSVFASIQACLNKKSYGITFLRKDVINAIKGKYVGRVSGGNLFLLINSLATPFEIDTEDSVLFIEGNDLLGRRIYKMLVQLEQAGKFKTVKTVVLGFFRDCPDSKEYLTEFFKRFDFPVIFTEKFGHQDLNIALPIGAKAQVDLEKNKIEFYFGAENLVSDNIVLY
jgi:muramoyltetrapeptide carboxypeptidase